MWQFSTKNIVRQAEERLKLKTAVFKLCDPAPSTTVTSYHSVQAIFNSFEASAYPTPLVEKF